MYVGYFLSRLRFPTDVSLRTTLLWQHPLTLSLWATQTIFEVVPGAEMARLIDRGACIVRHTISAKCDREAMQAFLFLHLLHLTTTHQQRTSSLPLVQLAQY